MVKILNLVIYDETNTSNCYNEMLQIQRTNVFPNVSTFFVQYRSQEDELVEDGDFIYVRGEETHLAILRKTCLALKYLLANNTYDYVLRSNISTITNFQELTKHLQDAPRNNLYTGGNIYNLQWLDPPCGIHDNSIFGLNYAQGTGIIMSVDVVSKFTDDSSTLLHNVIDDVSISQWLHTHFPICTEKIHAYKASYVELRGTFLPENILSYCFVRSRHNHDRNIDVENMKKVVAMIMGRQLL